MAGKAPSEGTKVSLGKNAPVTQEGTGVVTSDSLAAESQAFQSSNEGSTPQQLPHEDLTSSSRNTYQGGSSTSTSTGASTGGASRNVDTAPTYVNSQYIRDQAGPHGKNLKEDDSIGTEDKAKNASFTEFGTENDPGRLAEQKFTAADSVPSGATGGRQKGIDKETPYDVLSSEEQA